jgi:hypothetical protein
MRLVIRTCDECHDEDPSALPSVIEYDNGYAERADLCKFCRGEIAGARRLTEDEFAASEPLAA